MLPFINGLDLYEIRLFNVSTNFFYFIISDSKMEILWDFSEWVMRRNGALMLLWKNDSRYNLKYTKYQWHENSEYMD